MTTNSKQIHDALVADHEWLQATLEQLRDDADTDANRDLANAWDGFERQLLAHLEWEEIHLLPGFAQKAASEAAAFRADHARFRADLDRLGTRVELHAVRADEIDALVDALEAHAKREEATLYAWADEGPPPEARLSLVQRLKELTRHAVVPPTRGIE